MTIVNRLLGSNPMWSCVNFHLQAGTFGFRNVDIVVNSSGIAAAEEDLICTA